MPSRHHHHLALQNPKERGPWMRFWRKLRGTVDCASCVNPYGLMVHRDQAEREAKYGKQCMPRTGYAELILTHPNFSSKSRAFCYRTCRWKKNQCVQSMIYLQLHSAYEGQSGSKDRGDPQVKKWFWLLVSLKLTYMKTSNVFVANLPPHVTEETLGNFFAKVGPVGSVRNISLVFRSWSWCLLG